MNIVPTKKIVEMCDVLCQPTAPVKLSGKKVNVKFDFPQSVGLLVGIMDEKFTKTWWLNEKADSFTDKYSNIFTPRINTTVDIPSGIKKTGWLFWIVSVTPVNEMDWVDGIYEFIYYKFQIKEAVPTQYIQLRRNSPIMDRLYPNQIKRYHFTSSSVWSDSPRDRYPLSVKIEDFDSSRDSYDYHIMLQYGGNPCESDPLSMSDYNEIYTKMKAGSISWLSVYKGIYYDFSTMVTRLLKVRGNYDCSCWYLWIYNFGEIIIPRMRIQYIGPK